MRAVRVQTATGTRRRRRPRASLLPRVAGRLRDAGHQVEIALSRSRDEAAELVDRASGSGADVLAVMGGDGMAHLGLNAVAAHAAAWRFASALKRARAGVVTRNAASSSGGFAPGS